MKEIPGASPDFDPFEILREGVPMERMASEYQGRDGAKRSIDLPRWVLQSVDFELFRIYGPVRPNHSMSFHNSSEYLMEAGKHALSVDIPTSQGLVNVEFEAEYEWEGTRDRNARMKGFTARFRMGTEDEAKRFDMTVPTRSSALSYRNPGESPLDDYREWKRRRDVAYQESLPSPDVLQGFWGVRDLILQAAQEKYPNQRVGTPQDALYE